MLTQSQLARLLAATGPTGGQLHRPSDGAVPRHVFMLQCVGSRDCTSSGNEHCSAICCLFATLHASLIRQHHPDVEVAIGYTDMRTPGKSHEEYYRLAQTRGVNYVRGRVSEIVEEPDKQLRVRFEDTVTGRKNEELFNMVVLSAGLEASDGTAEIAHVAGLQTTGAGFLKEYHPKLRPVDTHRAGLFVCGTAQGPKSIPDSIAQAKAAASRVLAMLASGYVLTPGASRLVRREPVHRMRRLPVRLPAGGRLAFVACPPACGRQSECVPRVRDLCRRLSDRGHATGRVFGRRDHGGGVCMSPPRQAPPHPDAARRSIIALCCRECAYAAADSAANMRTPLPPSVAPGPGPVYRPGFAVALA